MEVTHKWYEIGVALGLPKARLDKIDYPTRDAESRINNADSKMRLMLHHVQEEFSFKFTWKKLIGEASAASADTFRS